MIIKDFFLKCILGLFLLAGSILNSQEWYRLTGDKYDIFYTRIDSVNVYEYILVIENGLSTVGEFFESPFKSKFLICLHPDRASLDSTWQREWHIPDFQSECWMVASGVANRLDMISPKLWDELSCEHRYSDSVKIQQLITHELVHVFHGQHCLSPDFSDVNGIDWFVEGLATYVSGQCDSTRVSSVKIAVAENQVPQDLENFWSGKLKYGFSGSMVMYIDLKYGRAKLNELLQYTDLSDLLDTLETTQENLISEWKSSLKD